MHPIYLDHNATTPCSETALEATALYHTEAFGNPSSKHWAGRASREGLDAARGHVATLLGCQPGEVVFTAGGTESDNIALNGAIVRMRDKGNHVIATPLEHPAVLLPLQRLAALGVVELTLLDVDAHGQIDIDQLRGALRETTALVAVMAAHNELGTLYPIADIAALTREAGAHFHCDGVQATGKVPIDLGASGIDTFAVSAHKLYGPKGVGCLVVRSGLTLEALMLGGGQEGGLRSGTENVPGIVGFGVAAELARASLDKEHGRQKRLRDMLCEGLSDVFPNMIVNTPLNNALPNTLHVSVPGLDAVAMLAVLDEEGIAASAGSACHSGGGGSSALRHIGLDGPALHGTLRLSLGQSTHEEDIEHVLDVFCERYSEATE